MSELSPAAQAVAKAALYVSSCDPEEYPHQAQRIAAAALRAAADQAIPGPIVAETPEHHWEILAIKNRFLLIADELDAQ